MLFYKFESLKSHGFSLIFYFFCWTQNQVFSQNLHVFSVVQSKDASRPDRALDNEKINELSNSIASYANFTRYYYEFSDKESFTTLSIKQNIQKLKFSKCNQDAVWIHFSGYGRNDDESIYPALQMGETEIYLRDIIGIVRQKSPKLLMISIDSGNEKRPVKELSNQASDQNRNISIQESNSIKIIKPLITNPIPKEMGLFNQVENYNSLFKKFDGTKVLIFQSNSVGENALSNVADGSYGLYCLDKAFKEVINEKNSIADWMKVKEYYIKYLQSKTKNRQTPKVTIEVPLDKCKDDE
jgi:hypothetical protein